MDLFPEGTFSTTDNFTSFVFMPIVHENRTSACIVLGSTKQRSPDTMFRGVVMSTSFQISSVASRCFLQERYQQECDCTRHHLDAAEIILVVVRCDGMIEMINRYGAKLLGYSDIDLIGGNWFEMIVPATVRENWLRIFELMVSGMLNVEDRVHFDPVLCSDGTEKSIRWRDSLLREGCVNVTGVVFSGKIILGEEKK
jgi:PAS domain S-box-containing protein